MKKNLNTSAISAHLEKILVQLGENPHREGLQDTPQRAAKALIDLTSGYQENLHAVVNGALFTSDMDEMVIAQNIEFYSLCEHHLLPFFGKCHIAYIPNGKVLGLSKIARIVDVFSKRLQIQEQFTKQLAEAIAEVTQTESVGVIVEAQHLCMMMRGIQKQHSSFSTSVMQGLFRKNHRTRAEFLSLLKKD